MNISPEQAAKILPEVREALEEIASKARTAGYDSGDEGILKIATNAIQLIDTPPT